MVANLKDFGATIWQMALVDSSLLMVTFLKVSGSMTKPTEKVITTMLKEPLRKDNGMKISKTKPEKPKKTNENGSKKVRTYWPLFLMLTSMLVTWWDTIK